MDSSPVTAQIRPRLTEVLSELAARIEQEVAATLAARVSADRRELLEALRHAMRRLLQAETPEGWATALLDAASAFSSRAALFSVQGQQLTGLCARGLDDQAAAQLSKLCIPIEQALAFHNAIETRDAVVALRTPDELSEALLALLGQAADNKAYLFPISASGRVAAVLYAEGDSSPADASGLELVVAMGECCYRGLPRAPAHPARTPPDWAQLSREDQELHLRALWFARVRVAEMRLYRSPAVNAGRACGNLYAELREEIDSAREAFGRQFLAASPTMVDYFHIELVRTLANDDAALLGEEYPGPLV